MNGLAPDRWNFTSENPAQWDKDGRRLLDRKSRRGWIIFEKIQLRPARRVCAFLRRRSGKFARLMEIIKMSVNYAEFSFWLRAAVYHLGFGGVMMTWIVVKYGYERSKKMIRAITLCVKDWNLNWSFMKILDRFLFRFSSEYFRNNDDETVDSDIFLNWFDFKTIVYNIIKCIYKNFVRFKNDITWILYIIIN